MQLFLNAAELLISLLQKLYHYEMMQLFVGFCFVYFRYLFITFKVLHFNNDEKLTLHNFLKILSPLWNMMVAALRCGNAWKQIKVDGQR